MDARTTPFTHMRYARGYQAERAMLESLDRHDGPAERMLDRLLHVLGGGPDAASASSTAPQPVA